MKQALLLIDLQNDFCPGGALAVPEGDKVIAVANRAIAFCRREDIPVVASLDWHPSNHGSFAVNSGGRVGEIGLLDGLSQVWWPVHCVQDTTGAQLHPELDAEGIRRRIYKGRQAGIDSYSAFYDNGHRAQTELHAYLQAQGIHSLSIMGLATDYCVNYTVLDALSLGYAVDVILDGCRGVDLHPGDSARVLEEMQRLGAGLITLAEFTAGC
ncbi:bifunctional nicotinamidase/pyrazinamidase [Sodalis ligni]|uniref:bifunctional nicotinamidase/pyrazinamidase n=1 Tax=Sodalis ligni TaxID=2697027 RepID=UPI00193EFBA9|nr:bifunctional nicotinamidase/pyrazinamidase [Sodalis ligni]QWA08964.1 bifunctional nicotinamidase/pyrazinamidase [Sodalis ligni]